MFNNILILSFRTGVDVHENYTFTELRIVNRDDHEDFYYNNYYIFPINYYSGMVRNELCIYARINLEIWLFICNPAFYNYCSSVSDYWKKEKVVLSYG